MAGTTIVFHSLVQFRSTLIPFLMCYGRLWSTSCLVFCNNLCKGGEYASFCIDARGQRCLLGSQCVHRVNCCGAPCEDISRKQGGEDENHRNGCVHDWIERTDTEQQRRH